MASIPAFCGALRSVHCFMDSSRHFLFVDDNREDYLLFREAFQSFCSDCPLTWFATGAEALTFLQSCAVLPDVILLGLAMPGLSGMDILGQLKRNPRLAGIPVLVLSDTGSSDHVRQAYDQGASAYLRKGHSAAEVLEQVAGFVTYWRIAQVAVDP